MKGKTCVVTGTTSGIGKETAVALAAAGAHVAIVCRTRDKGARALAEIRQRSGGEVSLFVADFGSQRAVRALAVRLAAALPRVDGLVNHAGTGVTANCLHPGVVASNFGNAGPALIRLAVRIGRPFMRSSARGAETSIYLASSPEVEGVSGKYFVNRREARSNDESYDSAVA